MTELPSQHTEAEQEQKDIASLNEWLPVFKSDIENSMLSDDSDSPGKWFEEMLEKGSLPSVIISEDATGRFSASVVKRFLGKISARLDAKTLNVPILSYPVGRFTPPTKTQQRAKEIRDIVKARYPERPMIFMTDIVETGLSIGPLVRALEDIQQAERLIVMASAKGPMELLSERHADRIKANPLNPLGASVSIRDPIIRPVIRESGAARALPVRQSKTLRDHRLKVIDTLANHMYEMFLKRPGVREKLQITD